MFAIDSPYQHPDTVRALFAAVRALEGSAHTQAAAEAARTADAPANPFVRRTSEEEARLAAGFDAGKSSAELARLHNRSRAAIEARLLKLGKIDASALTVQLRFPPKSADATPSPHPVTTANSHACDDGGRGSPAIAFGSRDEHREPREGRLRRGTMGSPLFVTGMPSAAR